MMLKLEFISGDPEDDTPTEIMEKTGLVPLGYICEPVVEVELEEEE
jgi:hypothetical protein